LPRKRRWKERPVFLIGIREILPAKWDILADTWTGATNGRKTCADRREHHV
jgi:hypothetical protein